MMKKAPKVVREPGHALTVSKTATPDSFTYADYQTWPDGERWEIIDGQAFAMTCPLQIHQETLLALSSNFYVFLKGKPCKVFIAPFDVRLKRKSETDEKCSTVVQPDLMVVCDKKKLDGKGVWGAPDLVVEILSPSNARFDLLQKLNVYELHKVPEYWIVDPAEKILMIFRIEESGRYGRPQVYDNNDKIKVGLFPDLVIEGKELFISVP